MHYKSQNEALGKKEAYLRAGMHSSAGTMKSLESIASLLCKLDERVSLVLGIPRLHPGDNSKDGSSSGHGSGVSSRSNISQRRSSARSIRDTPLPNEFSRVLKYPVPDRVVCN